jgi:anti-sigma-K factor RskA
MKQDEIKILLDKYMEGETSNTEEQELRLYFSQTSDTLPDEWEIYRALFCYEVKERNKLSAEAQQPTISAATQRKSWYKLIGWATSVAASVAIAALIFFTNESGETPYMLVNGVKVTDIDDINKEVDNVLSLLASDNDKAFSALDIINTQQ